MKKLEIPAVLERCALRDALDGDFGHYQELLGNEFGFVLSDQTTVNVAFCSLRFILGDAILAHGRSSYPPGYKIKINPTTLRQVVAPIPPDTLQ